MDKAGSHRNIIVKEAVSNTNNTLHYSLPYRPKTYSIETWFSQFKHYFIHEQRNKSYCNVMKYTYKNQKNREVIRNHSTRKRKSKEYKI